MSIGQRQIVILASASRARLRLLEAAGLAVDVDPPGLDEAPLKAQARHDRATAGACAARLADTKALAVAQRRLHGLVIGADQMLDCDGVWLDKPREPEDARQQLARLRGRTHQLHTAVAVAMNGRVLWHHLARAQLTMRLFSDAFLGDYVAAMGEQLLETVGGYHLEGLGVQLFERVDGDYFAILGLPLLPLLGFLRAEGVLSS